jgi:hypothetical protein
MKSRFIELTLMGEAQNKLLLMADKIVGIEKRPSGTLVGTTEGSGGCYQVTESPEEVRQLADAALRPAEPAQATGGKA